MQRLTPVRGVIPSFSPPLRPHSPSHRRPLPRLFHHPSPLALPLPNAALLFRLLPSSSQPAATITSTTRFTLFSFLSFARSRSSFTRTAMYLPGGTTYVNSRIYYGCRAASWFGFCPGRESRDEVRGTENRLLRCGDCSSFFPCYMRAEDERIAKNPMQRIVREKR